ncbi:MAG: ATP-binding protein [Myxococcota bacterium]
MNALAITCFVSAVVSTVMASSLVARDPGIKLNRLVAMVPLCIAHWGLMEALWTIQTDAASAEVLIRLSAFGWMSLGPLAFQIFVELAGSRARGLRPMVPYLWGLSAVSLVLYVASPWCLGEVLRTSWGWSYGFGPLFPLVYASTGLPIAYLLMDWSRAAPDESAPGERRVSRVIQVGVAIGLGLATLTDVVLPAVGRPVPQLSVPVLTAVVLAVAFELRRFGFSILSPAAFSEEILESLVDGVVMLRPDGRIRQANAAFARLVGESETRLRERSLRDFLPDLPRWLEERIDADPLRGLEAQLVPAAGGSVPVSLSSCALMRQLGPGLGSAVVVRDLRHVARLRERLVTTGRLAAVGELSAGIAHEIREPVATVRRELGDLRGRWSGMSRLCRADGGSDDEAAELLAEGEEIVDECLEGVDRITSIISDVAGLADQGRTTREAVDLGAVLDRALRVAIPRDEPGLVVERNSQPVGPVQGFAPQLEQVFTNLLRNAVHAVGGSGRIEVRTVPVGARVRVSIRDDGPGIDPEFRDRIFDPFFTTKPVGEGTGLGLAISYHIVQSHDGQIRVESAPGRGATFTVELPAREVRAAESTQVR